MIFNLRAPVAAALAVLVAAGIGLWLLADPDEVSRRHVVVGGVPLDEVHPPGVRLPGVVVAHGFAGSAKLMAQFGDSLSARGFVVVLLDFAGHGANTRPMADDAALQHDLDVATAHLRSLPDVDPSRIALVGHSMGASAVTRYAVAHPEITATVAMSLPDSSMVLPDRPERLLLLVGALEFPGFRVEAERAAEQSGGSMAATVVGAVVALVLPADYLPLALGSYIVGFTATSGVLILGYGRWRGRIPPTPGPGGWRMAVATPVLIGYAAAAVAVPVHLGLTHAIPAGARWWLLAVVWAGFALLAYGAERLTAGNSLGVLAVSAVAVIALTGAAAVGFTSGFVLLVVPLLGVLLLWQAAWSALLHRFSVPKWLVSLVGSLVVAWPLATALPVIG